MITPSVRGSEQGRSPTRERGRPARNLISGRRSRSVSGISQSSNPPPGVNGNGKVQRDPRRRCRSIPAAALAPPPDRLRAVPLSPTPPRRAEPHPGTRASRPQGPLFLAGGRGAVSGISQSSNHAPGVNRNGKVQGAPLRRSGSILAAESAPPTGSTAGRALVSPTPPQGGSDRRADTRERGRPGPYFWQEVAERQRAQSSNHPSGVKHSRSKQTHRSIPAAESPPPTGSTAGRALVSPTPPQGGSDRRAEPHPGARASRPQPYFWQEVAERQRDFSVKQPPLPA